MRSGAPPSPRRTSCIQGDEDGVVQLKAPIVNATGIRKSIVRNTAWNYVGFAVNLAVNLLLFPAAIAQMGETATGIWLLIGSVSGYMGLLQLGLAPAMAQFAAAHIATRDDDALARTVSTALVLVVGLGSVALVALPLVPWLLQVFSIPEALAGEARVAFILGIVGVPMQMPGHVFNAVLGASQRQDRCTQVWMVSLLGKLVGIAALLALGYGLEAIMWLETGLIVVTGVLLAAFAFAAAPQLRVGPHHVTGETARQLTGLGGWMFLNALSTSLIEQTDRIVIGLFLTVESVTYYSAAWKLYMLVYSVSTTLVQAIWPVAAGLHAAGDRASLQRLWLRMTKYTAALTWPLGWSLGLCAGPILHAWVGQSFAAHYAVVQVLVATFIVTAHNHAAFGVLGAMRRVGPIVQRYSVPQAVLNLLLSLWLVAPLGIFGVAVGTMVPAVLLEYTFLSFVLRELGLGWGDFWRGVMRPTLGPAAAAFLPTVVAYAALGPQSAWLLVVAAAASAVYTVLFWRGLHGEERDDLVAHLPAPVRAVLPA
jgi:O-antigen/teichoic acid export membrane protein